MVYELPDWADAAPRRTISPMVDLGELAARLGSVISYDRRGDVIWFDDFEDNIDKWDISISGTGAGVALSTDSARSKGKSAKLTTGDLTGDYALILRYLPHPIWSRIGFEISFTVNNDLDSIEMLINFLDGTDFHQGFIRYRPQLKRLEYWGEDAAWHTLATGIDLFAAVKMFHTMKLVVDPRVDEYVRFLLDDKDYDMAKIKFEHGAYPVAARVYFRLRIETAVDANRSIYVDDAIMTQNEP